MQILAFPLLLATSIMGYLGKSRCRASSLWMNVTFGPATFVRADEKCPLGESNRITVTSPPHLSVCCSWDELLYKTYRCTWYMMRAALLVLLFSFRLTSAIFTNYSRIERSISPFRRGLVNFSLLKPVRAALFSDCSAGSKCQLTLTCWLSGGAATSPCGPFFSCCSSSAEQKIQPAYYGPVRNDPYCGRSAENTRRIVGGNDATFGQFPWQVFVQIGGSRCGGALVAWRHVVTAGHCVAKSQFNPSNIRVTVGDFILNSDIESIPSESFGVQQVKLHPNFKFTPQADRYDVSVLILDRPVPYKYNMKPICLPEKNADFLGRIAYAAGWGALEAGSKLRPKVLQYVPVPVINNQICETWHRRRGINIRIYDEMLCAGYEFGGRDSCQGDSGGPLMINSYGVWYLIGIVSAGYSCAKQYQPGIYHRVSSSSDWISSNLY